MSEINKRGEKSIANGMSDAASELNYGYLSKCHPTPDGANFCRARRHLSRYIYIIHLSPSAATPIADLEVVELCFERLDRAVSQFEVLVQAIALRDQLNPGASAFNSRIRWVTHVLFPLPEARLLGLDLLGEPPTKLFLLLLELGVVELLDLALAILARLHLLLAVVLIVALFSSRDEVEHERADEQRAQLAEVTVILVIHCTSASTLDE